MSLGIKRLVHNFVKDSLHKKEYFARKLVGFSKAQMYSVVADVENYHHFVPFCTKSTIVSSKPQYIKAKLDIGFPPIIEAYTSTVTFIEPTLVKAVCRDGTLFTGLETKWRFSNGLNSNPQTCIVDFYINFEFKSSFYNHVAFLFFDKLVATMENAFINETRRRFGKDSIPIHALEGTHWEEEKS